MPGELVKIYRGPRGEAEVIVGLLHSQGLDAMVSTDDAGGARPDVGFVRGARVLVHAEDVEAAHRVIADAVPLAEG